MTFSSEMDPPLYLRQTLSSSIRSSLRTNPHQRWEQFSESSSTMSAYRSHYGSGRYSSSNLSQGSTCSHSKCAFNAPPAPLGPECSFRPLTSWEIGASELDRFKSTRSSSQKQVAKMSAWQKRKCERTKITKAVLLDRNPILNNKFVPPKQLRGQWHGADIER